MKKKLLLGAYLISGVTYAQTPLFQVGNDAIFYVGENALVYNGGGVQTVGNGIYDISGNVMVVGSSADALRTLNGTDQKTDGGNFILRLNDSVNYATSTYGQLYIRGISQSNITAIVDKEFRAAKHGTGNYFQQMALPFYDKTLNTLTEEFKKEFGITRFTQNEILKWNNAKVISDHYTDLSVNTTDPTGYYMMGSNGDNLDVSKQVYILRGKPYADTDNLSISLKDAGTSIEYGTNGTAINQYRERYNSYLQDAFDFGSGPWENNFGKNLYQFGNPFFTNLDLSKISYVETGIGDNNQILSIQGIKFDPGVIQTGTRGSTFSTGAKFITYSNQEIPVGDLDLVIKPMQTFVIKLKQETNDVRDGSINNVLNFNTLRRFNNSSRAESVDYNVTAKKSEKPVGTIKQLGIKGLDSNGQEIARAYYVVYPEAISGHTVQTTTQVTNSSTNLMGTFEEEAVNGGYDNNYTGKYWLYINEANEYDFEGKAVPFNLYGNDVKSLKFEVLENTVPLADDHHQLSTGIGFYYKAKNGAVSEVKQNQIIPVTTSEYNLYYGTTSVLSATDSVKPSRTIVVYSPAADDYVIRFDSMWKKANIKVFDMNGRLIKSYEQVNTVNDYPLNLAKIKAAYIVTATSDQGETLSTKILR